MSSAVPLTASALDVVGSTLLVCNVLRKHLDVEERFNYK